MLQMDKNSRTRLQVMREHKKQRMEELSSLTAKDSELCDILCTKPFSIDQESVPSLNQLEAYRAYLDKLTKEKVLLNFLSFLVTYCIVFNVVVTNMFDVFSGAPS